MAVRVLSSAYADEKRVAIGALQNVMDRASLEIQTFFTRVQAQAETLAVNQAIIRWLEGDPNPLYKELALQEIQNIHESDQYNTAFLASQKSQAFYIGNTFLSLLSPLDPDDSWYYETLLTKDKTNFNLDHNQDLGATYLWVNAPILSSEGHFLGVTGLGLNIDSLEERIKNLPHLDKVDVLLVDPQGKVELSSNPLYYNKNLNTLVGELKLKEISPPFSPDKVDPQQKIYLESPLGNTELRLLVLTRLEGFLSSYLAQIRYSNFMIIGLLLLLSTIFILIINNFHINMKELGLHQDIIILSMSMLAELRDQETGEHITRTQNYCRILAEGLREQREYRNYISKEYIQDLQRSAPLHDIGKVGVPDHILLKPGKLSPEEFEIIKTHPLQGEAVLKKAMNVLQYEHYYKIAIHIVRSHHEWWDGSGYPDGLKGEEIPLSARIMALADVYDALRTERPYKKPLPHHTVREMIKEQSGTHFDPLIVKVFLAEEEEFNRISQEDITL